ncbi:MAG TPA: tyrosine--tRNA ligase [Verrucomicrobiae bacterium]|nr:tyrosine--tRNA ligase [Verrucomicrobiae bacterium]
MDVETKISLVQQSPTEEVVTLDELRTLFETKTSPKHYIGLEISGKLHLGSLILTGFKINDFIKAGITTNVFLADWHTYINNKLNNDWNLITDISKYYEKAFKFFCPGVNVIFGSNLYDTTDNYWKNFVLFSKQITLARTLRSLTIMGRTEKDRLDFSQLLYPSMQSVDIKALDLDIVHAGTDQRKIHMLVREVFPKLGWKVPISVHHHLLPGLAEPKTNNDTSTSFESIDMKLKNDPSDTSSSNFHISEKNSDDSKIFNKMSKSNPSSSILIHDSEQEIFQKISKAFCPIGISRDNPILEIVEHIIFHQYSDFIIERPSKYGGKVSYISYAEIKKDYEQNKIHPKDLKVATAKYLNEIISPVRDYLYNSIPEYL